MEYWACDFQRVAGENIIMKDASQEENREAVHGTVLCLLARISVLLAGFLSIALTVFCPIAAVLTLVPIVLLVIGWWRHLAASVGFLWLGLCCLGFGLWDQMWSHRWSNEYVIAMVVLAACLLTNFLAWWAEKYGESDAPKN